MSAPQFTPGPWVVEPQGKGARGHWFQRASDGEYIAMSCKLSSQVEEDANARLIAAAPDGYDAAGAFIMAAINEWDIPEGRETDEGWLCDTLGHALADAFLKAMAFRAKARGEQ